MLPLNRGSNISLIYIYRLKYIIQFELRHIQMIRLIVFLNQFGNVLANCVLCGVEFYQ